jgi:hypothetical protein
MAACESLQIQEPDICRDGIFNLVSKYVKTLMFSTIMLKINDSPWIKLGCI